MRDRGIEQGLFTVWGLRLRWEWGGKAWGFEADSSPLLMISSWLNMRSGKLDAMYQANDWQYQNRQSVSINPLHTIWLLELTLHRIFHSNTNTVARIPMQHGRMQSNKGPAQDATLSHVLVLPFSCIPCLLARSSTEIKMWSLLLQEKTTSAMGVGNTMYRTYLLICWQKEATSLGKRDCWLELESILWYHWNNRRHWK